MVAVSIVHAHISPGRGQNLPTERSIRTGVQFRFSSLIQSRENVHVDQMGTLIISRCDVVQKYDVRTGFSHHQFVVYNRLLIVDQWDRGCNV